MASSTAFTKDRPEWAGESQTNNRDLRSKEPRRMPLHETLAGNTYNKVRIHIPRSIPMLRTVADDHFTHNLYTRPSATRPRPDLQYLSYDNKPLARAQAWMRKCGTPFGALGPQFSCASEQVPKMERIMNEIPGE